MSGYSQRLLRQRRRYRQMRGEWVLFGGVRYKVFVKEISGAQAGEQALPKGVYGVDIASCDPSAFSFDPLDFYPNTTVAPPIEGSEFTRNNLVYHCSDVTYKNEDNDTTKLLCKCLRKIWQTPTV